MEGDEDRTSIKAYKMELGKEKSNTLDYHKQTPLQMLLKDQDTDCLQFDVFQEDC